VTGLECEDGGVEWLIFLESLTRRCDMKKQVILGEKDIEQLHSDAEHLIWIYNRLVYHHGENSRCDYMRCLAKIINRLKEL